MKPPFILFAMALLLSQVVEAQNVGIGTTTPNANAALEIKSNNKGLLMPRLSTTARNSMTNVAKGMLVYDTTNAGFYYHDGGKWQPISQTNSDSAYNYTYPGIAPTVASMPLDFIIRKSGLYGTLYDNGGAVGNYANNSNGGYTLQNTDDSTALIKVDVEEMNIESPYDSLEIYADNDYEHKQLFTGNKTGTFYFSGDVNLEFRFRSNGVNNLSGFKINWTKITLNSQKAEAAPLTGWYFNSGKIAARGGVNANNIWASDNLGRYSFAFGQNAVAKGDHSYTLGNNSAALGNFSTAFGSENIARNHYSTAIGVGNEVIGSLGTAIGSSNRVSGFASVVIGTGLITKENSSYVIGAYNDTTTTNKLFEIGDGYNGSYRSNALTILRNGNTGIGTVAPTTTLEVNGGIKTKYSGSAIVNVTGTGTATLVYVPITTLPNGWDFTNTLVMVSVADGVTGIIYRTKLVTTSAIELVFEANAIGPTRFNYIVFKL